MGKGIILRVLEGTVLSPELTRKLGELLPDHTLETFQEKPDYKKSIKRRIDSLHEAFLFILDAYPLDPTFTALTKETLKDYAAECRAACDLTDASLDSLHPQLEQFTAKLVQVIAISWQWDVTESIECLNEAEQYLLMSKGRPDIATLTPMHLGDKHGTEYVLQYDQTEPAYYDEWIAELTSLKAKHFPKTPAWFRGLPDFLQIYFCNLDPKKPITPENLAKDLDAFIEQWGKIKTASLDFAGELNQIHKQIRPLPSWFDGFSVPMQEMIKILAGTPSTIDKGFGTFKKLLLEEGANATFKSSLNLVAEMPYWYWVLPPHQQCFLDHVVTKADKIEDAVSFLPTRLRTLPAPANFGSHSLIKVNAKGEAQLLFDKRYRHSHIVSRTALAGYPKAVQQRHNESNLAAVTRHVKSGQDILMQTLVSPIYVLDYAPTKLVSAAAALFSIPPDLSLYKDARTTVAQSELLGVIQSNHPYNYAQLFHPTKADNADSLALLGRCKKYLSAFPHLQVLIDNYKGALKAAYSWSRELFLSSLEQLIILTIGGYSTGSCVSGKDRKAIELLHTDAMMLYKEKYGSWPLLSTAKEHSDRKNFVSIVADLYLLRHHHELAGQNAPGSDGIKTPYWYWPTDISEAINKRLATSRGLEFDDRLATDNEVKYIGPIKLRTAAKNELLAVLIAKQLGKVVCTKLYDALTLLINETRQFQKSGKDWSPSLFNPDGGIATGITAIKSLMSDVSSGSDNISRLAKIFNIVLGRPGSEYDGTRPEATISVYDGLRGLCYPVKGTSAPKDPAVVASDWLRLFTASKEELAKEQKAKVALEEAPVAVAAH